MHRLTENSDYGWIDFANAESFMAAPEIIQEWPCIIIDIDSGEEVREVSFWHGSGVIHRYVHNDDGNVFSSDHSIDGSLPQVSERRQLVAWLPKDTC